MTELTKRKVIEYNKLICNIPKQLMKDFDAFCYKWGYSRVEGVKESIRRFIK